MPRIPDAPSVEPDDETTLLQLEEIELRDVGRTLIELGEQLQKIGELTKAKHLIERGVSYSRDSEGYDVMTEREVEMEIADTRFAMRETMAGLRKFRRSYVRWERLIAEFALTKMGYTQRDVAKYLGVSLTTVNRWAQNPLKIEDLS